MTLEKTAIKNERPAVMTTPKVRPPGEGDAATDTAGAKGEKANVEKTAIKNERPAVMTTPKVRPPGESDVRSPEDETGHN
jgi:hypothetical protein